MSQLPSAGPSPTTLICCPNETACTRRNMTRLLTTSGSSASASVPAPPSTDPLPGSPPCARLPLASAAHCAGGHARVATVRCRDESCACGKRRVAAQRLGALIDQAAPCPFTYKSFGHVLHPEVQAPPPVESCAQRVLHLPCATARHTGPSVTRLQAQQAHWMAM